MRLWKSKMRIILTLFNLIAMKTKLFLLFLIFPYLILKGYASEPCVKIDLIILDWPNTTYPENWTIKGYAFGTRTSNPRVRQKAAIPTRNQQQYQFGEMISPEFVIEKDFMQVVCSGVYHPTRCAVRLDVNDICVRSCSPESSSGFKKKGQRPATYWFDLRSLKGETARITVRDEHANGFLDSVKIVATNRTPPADARVVKSATSWLPDYFKTRISGDYLLVPVGYLTGTPLQTVTVEIAGRKKLKTDLPLAFGSIPVAGYLPIYNLTGYQGEILKVSFHSYTGHDPAKKSAKILVQREIPGRVISDTDPAFHIHPWLGMLNDPNGLVYLNGEYHLFHQYKYNISACSWAHYVSTDLMYWQERPIALFHDEMGSMHSGSAAVDVMNTSNWQKGDTPLIIAAYTASRGMGGDDKIQMQCIAYSDDNGKSFIKYEGNPVIGESEIWEKGSCNNRDPKIFWYSPTKGMGPDARDGFWVMVLYQDKGHTIFNSYNLKDWKEQSRIYGFRECPELFPLAIDGSPNQVRWIMYGAKGEYHIGSFDGKVFEPETKTKRSMFYSSKIPSRRRIYAAQTFNNTPKDYGGQPRRIQVSWLREGNGQISIPIELRLRTTPFGLRICMLPVKEIANLYTHSEKFDGMMLHSQNSNPFADIHGGLYDIDIEADLSNAKQLVMDIRGKKVVIDVTKDSIFLDEMKLPGTKHLALRVVVDNTSIEVFFGKHGLYYMPFNFLPESKNLSIKVIGGKAFFNKLQVHELKPIWKTG